MNVDSKRRSNARLIAISCSMTVLVLTLALAKVQPWKKTSAVAPEASSAATPATTVEHDHFVKQELGDITSPFTRETVVRLNSIVKKSLAAITKFDDMRRTGNENEVTVAQYRKLHLTASEAKSEMQLASQRVRDSGERYNDEILTAMAHFVDSVDLEIGEEINNLSNAGVLN